MSPNFKLSASALSLYLRSPKAFYWRYIKRLDPITLSVATFDHDRHAGIVWSAFVARFYAGMPEAENTAQLMKEWDDGVDGWCPPKAKERLTLALQAWASGYYQHFRPDDGCRVKSELRVENDRYVGYLDGWNPETGIVHEVKSTSQSPQLSEQLWKVQNSIQIKLYAVMTQAKGVVIEFAWKGAPYGIFRAPVLELTPGQLAQWQQELDSLADSIYALGDDPNNYVCNPDSCMIVSKNMVVPCGYQALCANLPSAEIAFKPKTHR